MQESPARCSHAQSALPPGMLCAEDAVLSPVPMQLPAGAPLPLTMGYVSIGALEKPYCFPGSICVLLCSWRAAFTRQRLCCRESARPCAMQ